MSAYTETNMAFEPNGPEYITYVFDKNPDYFIVVNPEQEEAQYEAYDLTDGAEIVGCYTTLLGASVALAARRGVLTLSAREAN